jgi:ferric-dicitrate binding protein FerR (iron transport regulator)
MRKEENSNMENYFQSNDSDTGWLEKMFEEEKDEPELKQAFKKKWFDVLNKNTEQVDLKHILYKIHYSINAKNRPVSTTRKLYNYFSKIASIVIFPLLFISIMWGINKYNPTTQYAEIVAPKGEKAQFVLPDGSTGYLNSGSTLKYAYPFTDNRTVKLSGEAFFDVTHSKKEFIVQTSKMKVKVHGTHFNVCAYNNETDFTTTLVEGSVSVVSNVDGRQIKLEPGQQAIFNKNDNSISSENVDVDLYVSWKENILRFHNSPFQDVVKKMERWYDVHIVLDDELKNTHRYTMSIKTESVREMLDLMSVTTPMRYKIAADTIFISSKTNMPMK